jgi:hypothetical protein
LAISATLSGSNANMQLAAGASTRVGSLNAIAIVFYTTQVTSDVALGFNVISGSHGFT